MRLLCGPLIDKELQPFNGCLKSDWHIASDGTVVKQTGQVDIISFELSDAGHGLLSHVMPHVPPGWQPDLLLFVIPERFLVPWDLAAMPCPIVVLVEDWYFNFEMLRELASVFDFWIVDHTVVPLLRRAGIDKVLGFQVFALDLARFEPVEAGADCFDVGFIGNLRTSVHSRRAHYLARLAGLAGRWRIGIATERYGEDYIRFFKQCQIIFNYSLHGEFNMRCYEALGCGRLMLLEAQNQEVPLFLTPGEHYVSYRSENLEALIAYYLGHSEARERIARAGQQAIQRYGAQQSWAQLRRILDDGLRSGVIQVSPERSLSLAGRLQNLFWSVNPPYNQMRIAGGVLQEQVREGANACQVNDLAVIYYTYWLSEGAPASSAALDEARRLLTLALQTLPRHPIADYNQGQVLALIQAPELALASFRRCCEHLDQSIDFPWGLVAYPRLHLMYEKFFHPWFMAQSQLQYVYADCDQSLAQARKRLLKAHALRHIGDLELGLGHVWAAYAAWNTALQIGQNWMRDLVANFMSLCLQLDLPQVALQAWASGWGDPLAPELWLMHCRALLADGQDLAAQAWYQRYQRMKASFLGSLESEWQQLFAAWPDALPEAGGVWQAALRRHLSDSLALPQACIDPWLFAWCGLSWQVTMPEPLPQFRGLLGVLTSAGTHFHYRALITDSGCSDSQSLCRSYHQASDFERGIIGIDLLPCSFPELEARPIAELEDLSSPLCLMLLEDYNTLPLVELARLQALEAPPVVALWHPFAEPSELETECLSAQLVAFEGLELILLPRLEVAEQKALLQQVTRLWLQPAGSLLYYLWWALQLGCRPWLSQPLDPTTPCPGFDASALLPFVSQNWLDGEDEALETLRQAMMSHSLQGPALLERCAWNLRAWLVRNHWQGAIWTQADPHLNPAL